MSNKRSQNRIYNLKKSNKIRFLRNIFILRPSVSPNYHSLEFQTLNPIYFLSRDFIDQITDQYKYSVLV